MIHKQLDAMETLLCNEVGIFISDAIKVLVMKMQIVN
jgi:hypothetical protein